MSERFKNPADNPRYASDPAATGRLVKLKYRTELENTVLTIGIILIAVTLAIWRIYTFSDVFR